MKFIILNMDNDVRILLRVDYIEYIKGYEKHSYIKTLNGNEITVNHGLSDVGDILKWLNKGV